MLSTSVGFRIFWALAIGHFSLYRSGYLHGPPSNDTFSSSTHTCSQLESNVSSCIIYLFSAFHAIASSITLLSSSFLIVKTSTRAVCRRASIRVRFATMHTVSVRKRHSSNRARVLGRHCQYHLTHSSDLAEVSHPSRSAMATASSNYDSTVVHLVLVSALSDSVLLHGLTSFAGLPIPIFASVINLLQSYSILR